MQCLHWLLVSSVRLGQAIGDLLAVAKMPKTSSEFHWRFLPFAGDGTSEASFGTAILLLVPWAGGQPVWPQDTEL